MKHINPIESLAQPPDPPESPIDSRNAKPPAAIVDEPTVEKLS